MSTDDARSLTVATPAPRPVARALVDLRSSGTVMALATGMVGYHGANDSVVCQMYLNGKADPAAVGVAGVDANLMGARLTVAGSWTASSAGTYTVSLACSGTVPGQSLNLKDLQLDVWRG